MRVDKSEGRGPTKVEKVPSSLPQGVKSVVSRSYREGAPLEPANIDHLQTLRQFSCRAAEQRVRVLAQHTARRILLLPPTHARRGEFDFK